MKRIKKDMTTFLKCSYLRITSQNSLDKVKFLINAEGYMIRDITERSGGAQIKILSDRQSERDAKECIISINGTR